MIYALYAIREIGAIRKALHPNGSAGLMLREGFNNQARVHRIAFIYMGNSEGEQGNLVLNFTDTPV